MKRAHLLIGFITLWLTVSVAATAATAPRVIWSFATLEKQPGGWRCSQINSAEVGELFKQLANHDVLIAIGNRSLVDVDTVGLVTALRRMKFGLETEATVLRGQDRVVLHDPPASPHSEYFEVVAASDSREVLLSTVVGIVAGDVLVSVGDKTWAQLSAGVVEKAIPFVQVPIEKGVVIEARRNGRRILVATNLPIVLNLALFPKGESHDLASITLRGLNTPDVSLAAERGHWLLLHFWGTWCPPCIKATPALLELAKSNDLHVAAIGFADSDDRLRAFAEKGHVPRVFAPSPELTRALSLDGVPYDVLVNPAGEPVLIIYGAVPLEQMRSAILSYVRTRN